MYQTLIYDLTDGVATLTLNRPDKMNALTRTLRAELSAAMSRASAEARAIVLTGAGRGFCSGQDLMDAGGFHELDMERTLRDEYEPLLKLIYDCPVPTICAVNGAAAGAGANLALAADIVIAARSASFIEAFARIGLIPDAGGTYWLPRLVGGARAMAMCLTTEPIPATRAADWGLIWSCVEDAELIPHVTALAQKLAKGPTLAYRLCKQALRAAPGNSLDAQLALEAQLQGVAGASHDFREGVMAFLEKRAPRYTGN